MYLGDRVLLCKNVDAIASWRLEQKLKGMVGGTEGGWL